MSKWASHKKKKTIPDPIRLFLSATLLSLTTKKHGRKTEGQTPTKSTRIRRFLTSQISPYEDEPGKQARSAIRIKNTSKFHVAFKFQTTVPKSCYMRPPGGILAPGENILATVFKFVEQPENNEKVIGQKSWAKFKIMSLKVNGEMDYVPELFDEQKDQVLVEQILQVVFLDTERPSLALEKLNRQLAEAEAEAEAELQAHKMCPEESGPRVVGEGLVIDEWKERRGKYLARQQVERVDSVYRDCF